MLCPFCGHVADKVVDSRESKPGDAIRRRRECLQCERRFTTYERIEQVMPLVVKKDTRREPFDRLKIIAGLRRACEKRPVAWDSVEALVDRVEREVMESGDKEIESSKIGEKVMAGLRELDQVAYVRFASVYRDFKDIHEFMAELSELLSSPKGAAK